MAAQIDEQTVTALVPGPATVTPIEGTLTFDSTWSPYAQGSLTIPLPADLTPFDPRSSPPPRVALTMFQRYSDSDLVSKFTTLYGAGTVAALTTALGAGTVAAITAAHDHPWVAGETRRPVRRTASLGIRSRRRGRDGTLILELASDEALLQDFARLTNIVMSSTGYPYIGPMTLIALIQFVMAQALPAAVFVETTIDYDLSAFGVYYPAGPVTGIPWEAGVSAWDFLSPFLQVAGARLWCDELGYWHLTAEPYTAGTTLALTTSKTITEFVDEITRDSDWYDAVVVYYTWTGSTGQPLFYIDPYGSYTFSRVKLVERPLTNVPNPDTFVPPSGAAQYIYGRVVALGRTVPLTAITDFAANPGQPITVTLPGSAALAGYLDGVTWDFAAREMTINARALV